jgi:uncharacterized phage-like protein YoqJ
MIIAATGHRPHKLGGYGSDTHKRLLRLARSYLEQQEKPEAIISGMALGWDMAWAMAGLELDIPLIAAVPFDGQESRWPREEQRVYQRLLARASEVQVINPGSYAPEKFERRNEWMVDAAPRVAALWSGAPGGTARCVAYADSQQKPVDNLWPLWRSPGLAPAPQTANGAEAFSVRPVGAQYRRGCKMESPNGLPTVYVGRPTWAGNPFKVGTPEAPNRGDAVRLFEAYIPTRPDLIARAKKELRGKNLACWCPLDGGPCHRNTWLRIANS